VFLIFQELIEKYGKILIALGIIGVVILFYFLQQNGQDETSLISTIPEQQIVEQIEEDTESSDVPPSVIVDVKGAVRHPGVYELSAEDRIIDAVQLAGGYLEEAETTFINHAQKLEDEMVIYIPKKGEKLPSDTPGPLQTFPSITTKTKSNEQSKVNINTAGESELMTLPGIGPSKAQAIIQYRDEHGAFKQIEDIKNISGIGEKTFEKLKDSITVR